MRQQRFIIKGELNGEVRYLSSTYDHTYRTSKDKRRALLLTEAELSAKGWARGYIRRMLADGFRLMKVEELQ